MSAWPAAARPAAPEPAADQLPLLDPPSPGEPELTVLSYGGGQDSTALLAMYALDHQGFRQRWAPRRFLVVMADTGDEHPETSRHVDWTRAFCREHGIEFHHLALGQGWHPRLWAGGLRAFYRAKRTVGSKAFRKWCMDNLKLVPIYRFLEAWIGREYRLPTGGKRGYAALADLLATLAARGASDLHLVADAPPHLRVDGRLVPIGAAPVAGPAIAALAASVMTEDQRARFAERRLLDFAFAVPGRPGSGATPRSSAAPSASPCAASSPRSPPSTSSACRRSSPAWPGRPAASSSSPALRAPASRPPWPPSST